MLAKCAYWLARLLWAHLQLQQMNRHVFFFLLVLLLGVAVVSSPAQDRQSSPGAQNAPAAQGQAQTTQPHEATSDSSEAESPFGDPTGYHQRPILKPGESVATDPNTPAGTTWVNPKDGLTYVWIPPGKFMMGCSPGDTECDPDETPHEVTIDHGFWIGQTLVTQGAYKRVTGENPSFYKHGDQFPVDKVDYEDAYGYCVAVGMRLPTESEWEYAARANTTTARYSDDLDAIAWYKDNSYMHPHEVAQKEPNAFHLYDMLGNMWQWTATRTGRGAGGLILRGGSWMARASTIRVSIRGRDHAEGARRFTSFRCVSGSYKDTADDVVSLPSREGIRIAPSDDE
jgi:formylglycine-generating enzyme required for sulfatase activity